MEIVEYQEKFYEKWNQFVLQDSINGTFLQSKRFLDYHPKERFQDASILVMNKGNIAAVCPACSIVEAHGKVFCSHKGSTYGGLVVSPKYYKTEKLLEIIDLVEQYLQERGYNQIEYKITPDILQYENSDLLQFCLQHKGYGQEVFLNTYIDLMYYKDDILGNFEQGKRTNVHNCIREGLITQRLTDVGQIEEFYELLCITLSKYGLKPVHSIAEIRLLQEQRLRDEVELYGIYKGKEMVAGSMMFCFENAKCMHAQYLAAKPGYEKLSPMTYAYYAMISKAKEKGYRYVSWGISTEHDGTINYGLTRSKEAYGSFHLLNRIFKKNLENCD